MTERSRKDTRVLVIDDIADKGLTLHAVNDYLKNMFTKVDFATIYYKMSSSFIPDYWIETVDNDLWISFPYEMEELK